MHYAVRFFDSISETNKVNNKWQMSNKYIQVNIHLWYKKGNIFQVWNYHPSCTKKICVEWSQLLNNLYNITLRHGSHIKLSAMTWNTKEQNFSILNDNIYLFLPSCRQERYYNTDIPGILILCWLGLLVVRNVFDFRGEYKNHPYRWLYQGQ